MNDPLWYKDAIIYQLHVKAFFDANNDGMGDFAGLADRLDYLQDLGVTALWLLPFYPSPMRDDGYDIAGYKQINPNYGSMSDFRNFVRAAHARGLKVITELVVNHTSDQHPWFQRARRARPGSAWRDFYVWSDSDQKYKDTRIIFTDTETSNWAWDPVAKAYYWHRFFSHQPDLNFDNPRVLKAIINVMEFWLDAGVDGLRLDAVPYLCEREGTNNENLAETHQVIKQIRAALDANYPGRMLLAEANQWPEDVNAYFGSGDECHMAFHFPLMPRIYMAVAQEDRHPIVDIMRQTPEIPEICQWATFLRNHDELTLEMVTDQERDYLWNFYAADRRARINVGIRRRLAPLMENDRRKIELLNSLLLSMPGTPVLYYGDEIGMGDNIFLGDRNGVRTPMQWSPDRSGGFSRADPASLYLPPIMDPVYGFEAVNVEAQRRNPSSLLNWMRQLIAAAKPRRFGRGTIRFLQPANRKVLAYLRQQDSETVLCVANMSRAAQPVELALQEFNGFRPLELMGQSGFPMIGELPYLLTLPAYGFYWFLLQPPGEPGPEAYAQSIPDLLTLVAPRGWSSIVSEGARQTLEKQILPGFLPSQRWFAGKTSRIADVRIATSGEIASNSPSNFLVSLFTVEFSDAPPQTYSLPLAVTWEELGNQEQMQQLMPFALARVRRGARVGTVFDAFANERFARALLKGIADAEPLSVSEGEIHFFRTTAFSEPETPIDEISVRRVGADQSNTSIVIGETMILKGYRRLQFGIHPELEISRFLTEVAHFANTPALYGGVEWVDATGNRAALGILQAMIANQGDGWKVTADYLGRYLEDTRLRSPDEAAPEADAGSLAYFRELARRLGQRTGEMHRALAIESGDPDFDPEPIDSGDLQNWADQATQQLEKAFDALQAASIPNNLAAEVSALRARRGELGRMVQQLVPQQVAATKTRHHGDFHLGQVLVAKADFYIVDFEGEPSRSIEERRRKHSPLRDVAGMLRSFNYARWSALFHVSETFPEEFDRLIPAAEMWEREAAQCFVTGYREGILECSSWPQDETQMQGLLNLFLLEKAAYEICYEAANRPQWLHIPLRGVLSLLQPKDGADHAGT